MNTMEQNRQIVQNGLDKRKNNRKKAIIEAEQEVITIKMFQIVNTNACNAEEKYQPVYSETTIRKTDKYPGKRTAMLKKHRTVAVVNIIASLLALIISAVFYVINLTELLYMVAASIPSAFMLIFNLCIFVKAQKKLKRRG